MNRTDYVRLSLELHLFFDRIMKEHSFFLETAFMEKDKDFKRIAHDFQKNFSNILSRIVELANNNISQNFLNSGEIITNNILEAEMKTSNLSGIEIDSNITRKQIELRSGRINVNERLINSISNINRRTLPLIGNLIDFKTNILNNVISCKMYTTNYPLLISHIISEAKMYYNLLNKIEKVCSGEITPVPNKIKYLPYIEQSVDCIEENIEKYSTFAVQKEKSKWQSRFW